MLPESEVAMAVVPQEELQFVMLSIAKSYRKVGKIPSFLYPFSLDVCYDRHVEDWTFMQEARRAYCQEG